MAPGGDVPARVVLIDPATGDQTVLTSGGNLELPTGVVISQTGQILIADPQTDEAVPGLVVRVNPMTGQQTVLSGGESILQRPTHLAIEPTGHLVVSDPELIAVVRIDRNDLSQGVVSSGDLFVRPGAIAVASDGTIYVADAEANRILRVHPGDGSQSIVAEGVNLIRPTDMGIDPAGRLVVVDPDAFGGGALLRVDRGTGAQELILLGRYLQDPEYVAVSRSGEALVSVNGGVTAIDPATGLPSRFYGEGLLRWPRGIEVAPDGEIWVADQGAGQEPRILRLNPESGAQSLVTQAQLLDAPSDLAFTDDGDLLVADESAGAVIRVDPTTGAQEIETSVPVGTLGVAARDDRIWLSGDGNVRRIDADGSSETIFSGGDDFFAIDFDAQGELVVADPDDDAVRAIDPEDGSATTIASGDLLARPRSVTVVSEPGRVPALLAALGALAALRLGVARVRSP
jgi:DNA-binding beta-propeller fold protein YncE